MARVFISYARVDVYLVKQLVGILVAGGHEPWFDHRLLPGQDWKAQLIDGIRHCTAVIYALTPESVASEWCRWEFTKAIELGKPIIPVLFQSNTELSDVLSRFQYVDFSQGPTPEATARLLGGLANLSVIIPPNEAPSPPANPRGYPSRVSKELALAVLATEKNAPPEPHPPSRHEMLHLMATRERAAATLPNVRPPPPYPAPSAPQWGWIAGIGVVAGLVMLLGMIGVSADGGAGCCAVPPLGALPASLTPWSTPAATSIPGAHTPTPAPPAVECPGVQPSQLAVGMMARIPRGLGTSFRLRVRVAPSRDSDTVTRAAPGVIFEVIGGPECADGYLWWEVQMDSGEAGWAAESDRAGYYMLPVQQPG
jgi:hypothetical protein